MKMPNLDRKLKSLQRDFAALRTSTGSLNDDERYAKVKATVWPEFDRKCAEPPKVIEVGTRGGF